MAFEWYLSYRQKKDFYDGKDTVAALVIGLINVGMSAAIKVITFGIILFFYNLVPWTIPMTWWAFIICLFWLDFWRYWAHRIAHENRFWWATHVTHHNSEKYNWSVSFRLSWTQHIKIIFFIPVALAGFHPVVFFIVHQLAVLYQFWIHTEYITKLPRSISLPLLLIIVCTMPRMKNTWTKTMVQLLSSGTGFSVLSNLRKKNQIMD